MADQVQSIVEDATFDFAMGENDQALAKLDKAVELDPKSFEAWHAIAEIHFSVRQLDKALEAANQAHEIRPDDIHIHTSLSRIHMERGDKIKAEEHGAKARMLGWREQLQGEPEED